MPAPEDDPIDALIEQLQATFPHMFFGPEAIGQLCGAHTAVRLWALPEKPMRGDFPDAPIPIPPRKRAIHFFTFILMAYELASGKRAGVSWKKIEFDTGRDTWDAAEASGDFLAMARMCAKALLPEKLRPKSDVGLGRALKRAASRRTRDGMPHRGPKGKLMPVIR
jgi:hypothetical protein